MPDTIEIGDFTEGKAFWAEQIVKKGQKHLRGDLAESISSISLTDTMEGASTMEVSLLDPGWGWIDSGLFDGDKNGALEVLEVNFPDGSDNWWRLTAADIDGSMADATVKLTFMEREAAILTRLHGPLKASRSAMTRAQFIKKLTARAPHSDFVCSQMGTKLTHKEKTDRNLKLPGISTKASVTIKQHDQSSFKLTAGQIRLVNRVLKEAYKVTKVEDAILAALCAIIVENQISNSAAHNDLDSEGMYQFRASNESDFNISATDVEACTRLFLLHGFTAGPKGDRGAIKSIKSGFSIGDAAQRAEGSGHPERYQKVLGGARKLLRLYGKGSDPGLAATTMQKLNFQVGGTDNPHESLWSAATRLADEVNWALFSCAGIFYYDREKILIQQQPVAVVKRTTPGFLGIEGTFDGRNIASEVTLDLVCDPFEFRAGEVFQLEGFGPLSSGSSAKLPGHWLISEVERDLSNFSSSFTLKQPEAEKAEPRPEKKDNADESSGEQIGLSGSVPALHTAERAYYEAVQISNVGGPYKWGGGHSRSLAGFPNSLVKNPGLDCSGSVSLALWRAGMHGRFAAVSGGFASYGDPGEGAKMTIWYNDEHVWIEFNIPGVGYRRFDTSPHGDGPRGPRIRKSKRSTSGFTPRQYGGKNKPSHNDAAANLLGVGD